VRKRNKWSTWPRVVLAIALVLIAFVVVATVVQAVREDSWGLILMIGWLPAVLVGLLYRQPGEPSCRPRLRRLAKR
jgi:hypothetical protein